LYYKVPSALLKTPFLNPAPSPFLTPIQEGLGMTCVPADPSQNNQVPLQTDKVQYNVAGKYSQDLYGSSTIQNTTAIIVLACFFIFILFGVPILYRSVKPKKEQIYWFDTFFFFMCFIWGVCLMKEGSDIPNKSEFFAGVAVLFLAVASVIVLIYYKNADPAYAGNGWDIGIEMDFRKHLPVFLVVFVIFVLWVGLGLGLGGGGAKSHWILVFPVCYTLLLCYYRYLIINVNNDT